MKKVLTPLLFLTVFMLNAYGQKKAGLPKTRIVGTSDLSKADQWKENFQFGKEKYNVYLGYQAINNNLRQVKGDTLQVYKITFDKRKSSQIEITKYATRNGKIIVEGFYKIEKNVLVVVYNTYDYIGAYKTTTQYSPDKYGFFNEIDQKTIALDTDKLSEKYIKPAEQKTIFLPKTN